MATVARRVRELLRSVKSCRKVWDVIVAPTYVHLCSWPPIRSRIAPYLGALSRKFQYSPTGTGINPALEVKRLASAGCITGRTVLVIGIERGDEIPQLWLPLRPRCLVGIDLVAWPEQWREVAARAKDCGTDLKLLQMDATRCGFQDCSFDLIYSQSLLEHVTDIEAFLSEMRRTLKPGGVLSVFFGPLWHCYGGPHIGALGYDHLLLSSDEFLQKAKAIGNGWEYWVNKGLFSTYTLQQYLDAFDRYFEVGRLALVGTPEGEAYRSSHPEEWKVLVGKASELDLLVRLISVTARHCASYRGHTTEPSSML